MIRVLLAENHETVRAGLRLLVDAQHDMTVVAEASTSDEALERVRTLHPDVAVLDLTMPGGGGLGVARALKDHPQATRLVVLTRHNDDAYVRELMEAGTAAYVLKHSASGELLEAIRAASRNESYLDTALRPALAGTPARGAGATLTRREQAVLRLTATGYSNKEIATQLEISVRTVEVHKTNGMRKLHLSGRSDLVRYAVLQGWMRDP